MITNITLKKITDIMKEGNLDGIANAKDCLDKFYTIEKNYEDSIKLLMSKQPKLFYRYIEPHSYKENQTKIQRITS